MTDILDPERWARVASLFDEASALPPPDRDAYLIAQCAGDRDLHRHVQSLFEHDGVDDDAFESGIQQALLDEASSIQAGEPPFERLGAYRLISQIGRGGMGMVYLAERDGDPSAPIEAGRRARVAIKLVRVVPGADLSERFKSERQILASLRHPGIAQLIDGGTTPGGLPYFVMELVEGLPITEYCDAHTLGARERLTLFLRVCEAVSHAHRRLVVHRDLKPSNILVTAGGTPKLLDFGIAKLLGPDAPSQHLTTPSQRLLTPEYASPEQTRGEPITTATDVYSLGVLLCELLTGQRPGAPAPRRPLSRDLDTIVRAAIDEDPIRRCGSVERLADDITRVLEGRPVLARPSTWRYRTRRFVGRHRAAVATAAALAILVLVLATTLARSISRADRARDAANRVSAILVETFAEPADPADGSTRGPAITARERLDRGLERVRRDLRGEPAMQARLFDALGAIYSGLGLIDQAQAVLRESIAARAAGGAADSQESARTMWRLADVLRERRQLAAAEPLARAALDMNTRLVGRRNPQTAQTMISLGAILAGLGRRDEAEALFVDATSILRSTLGPDSPTVPLGLMNLAAVRRDKGDLAGAERIAREAMDLRARTLGAALDESLQALADVVGAQGRADEASQIRRDAASRRVMASP